MTTSTTASPTPVLVLTDSTAVTVDLSREGLIKERHPEASDLAYIALTPGGLKLFLTKYTNRDLLAIVYDKIVEAALDPECTCLDLREECKSLRTAARVANHIMDDDDSVKLHDITLSSAEARRLSELNKISAIKAIRDRFGLGLKPAKSAVDELQSVYKWRSWPTSHGGPPAREMEWDMPKGVSEWAV